MKSQQRRKLIFPASAAAAAAAIDSLCVEHEKAFYFQNLIFALEKSGENSEERGRSFLTISFHFGAEQTSLKTFKWRPESARHHHHHLDVTRSAILGLLSARAAVRRAVPTIVASGF